MKIRRGDTEITFESVTELKQVIDEGMFDIIWSMMMEEEDMLWGYSLEGEHAEWNNEPFVSMFSADLASEEDPNITFVQLSPEQEEEVINLLVQSNMFGENLSLTEDSINDDGTIDFIIESDDLHVPDEADPEVAAEKLIEWMRKSASKKSYKKDRLTSNGEKLDLNELLLGDKTVSNEAEQALSEQDANVMELWKRLK